MPPSKEIRLGPDRPYDVIVCGAGHAGVEAALAAARMGADVLLLTGNVDTVAQMSCNPAIGGQAKGHIVREIDALGGEMGLTADVTGIQFRLLNASKGPAVQAPRVQCDKKAYQFRMKHLCELQAGLTMFQAQVTGPWRYVKRTVPFSSGTPTVSRRLWIVSPANASRSHSFRFV